MKGNYDKALRYLNNAIEVTDNDFSFYKARSRIYSALVKQGKTEYSTLVEKDLAMSEKVHNENPEAIGTLPSPNEDKLKKSFCR